MPHVLPAQSDTSLNVTGFYQFYAGVRLHGDGDFLAARNRGDINLKYTYEQGRIYLSNRLTHNLMPSADTPVTYDLREAFLDAYWDRVDVRLGLQHIVWGEADGAFITDLLSPLDLTEFLAQDFQDIRKAIPALSVTYYAGTLTLNSVWIPRPLSSDLPSINSPWNPINQLGADHSYALHISNAGLPDFTIKNSEFAIRGTYDGLSRTSINLMYLYAWNRVPAFFKQIGLNGQGELEINIDPIHYRRHVAGFTFSTVPADTWIVRGEAAYHTREFFDVALNLSDLGVSDGFLLEKPFAQTMLGLEHGFGNQTVRVQGLNDWIFEHESQLIQDASVPALTLLWNGRFCHETLTAQVFVYYNIGEDYWLNPSLTYAVSDGLNATLGVQWFAGSTDAQQAFSFGLYDQNDFVYVNVKYDF